MEFEVLNFVKGYTLQSRLTDSSVMLKYLEFSQIAFLEDSND